MGMDGNGLSVAEPASTERNTNFNIKTNTNSGISDMQSI